MAELEDLAASPEWQALRDHAKRMQSHSLRDLFEVEPNRAERFGLTGPALYLDFSKQCIDGSSWQALLGLADKADLSAWIQRLFAGEAINHTEDRAAMHMALRAPQDRPMQAAGAPVTQAVHEVRQRMSAFVARVREGEWCGFGGQAISDVVNIGIGGSDLGPRMVVRALGKASSGPRVHFIANVDGGPISSLLESLDPARTLIVITSKTFTTQETMANAAAARQWLVAAGGEPAVAQHFVAVSTNQAAVQAFGIEADNMFGFWEWVGGRYSLWSAVGLSIELALGSAEFGELLAGAHAMDEHFRTQPAAENIPVVMGLLGIWNRNFLGSSTHVVAPYLQALEHFPAWLQQLEMESNGKSVRRDGTPLAVPATPVLWGDCGTNGQHAFFQLLHQGLEVHPVDFVLAARADHRLTEQHQMLTANCLAQSAALAFGKTAAEVEAELHAKGLSGQALVDAVPHRCFAGNRPSNTLMMDALNPYSLGALLALYEHRTFVQSVLWQINPFDQWGVELGKQLAGRVLAALQEGEADAADGLDASTRSLLRRLGS